MNLLKNWFIVWKDREWTKEEPVIKWLMYIKYICWVRLEIPLQNDSVESDDCYYKTQKYEFDRWRIFLAVLICGIYQTRQDCDLSEYIIERFQKSFKYLGFETSNQEFPLLGHNAKALSEVFHK